MIALLRHLKRLEKIVLGASFTYLMLASGASAQQPPPRDNGAAPDQQQIAGSAKSVRFRIRVCCIALGLTCPDDEPLKTCADFAI